MKNSIKVIAFIFLMTIVSHNKTEAQEIIWGNSAGLFGGFNLNFHSVEMTPSFSVPQKVNTKFNDNISSFTGFCGIEGNFQTSNITVVTGRIGLGFNGMDVEQKTGINTVNSLSTNLTYLTIAPMIKFVNIVPKLEPLYFTTGVNIGIPLVKKFDFTQQIGSIKPKTQSADIPDASLHISIPIGVGYIYKIDDKFSVIPEVSYNISFSGISSNSSWQEWNFQQIKAGVTVTYLLPKLFSGKKDNNLGSGENAINVTIKEIYYHDRDDDESKQTLNNIQLEEAEYGEYFPIIPYIFYDVNETEIDKKYKKTVIKNENVSTAAGKTEEDTISIDNTNAFDVNYQVIDIIAKRMRNTPNANLTITGTIDGKVETNKQVSEYRALGVKKYIVENYEIEEDRIVVTHGQPPSKPSANTVKDGVVENRRVELSSNSPTLFEPVFIKGERHRIATPDNVVFVPEVDTNYKIKSWNLEILQADKVIKTITGDTIGPIQWNIGMNELYPSQVPIEYKLSVFSEDNAGTVVGHIGMDYITSEKKKTIEQPDKIISKFSLVLFDFDSPVVTEQNKSIIDKLVIPNIKYGSTVDIYGYTDRIGFGEYNKRLSLARANAVKEYIRTKNRNVSINTFGLGSDTTIFDNDIPMGRQLSRTVQILVVTPK